MGMQNTIITCLTALNLKLFEQLLDLAVVGGRCTFEPCPRTTLMIYFRISAFRNEGDVRCAGVRDGENGATFGLASAKLASHDLIRERGMHTSRSGPGLVYTYACRRLEPQFGAP